MSDNAFRIVVVVMLALLVIGVASNAVLGFKQLAHQEGGRGRMQRGAGFFHPTFGGGRGPGFGLEGGNGPGGLAGGGGRGQGQQGSLFSVDQLGS